MVKKKYNWEDGAKLEDHTKKKHEILKKYFRQYLITRCQPPQRTRFRLIIVDGFAGAGLYEGGHYGSPIIFIDVLKTTVDEINLARASQGFGSIEIECLLILNDESRATAARLRQNVTPHILSCAEGGRKLRIHPEYFSDNFEDLYPQIKQKINSIKCGNVLFNLDQCGYSHVTSTLIRDIISSWRSAEVVLTFMIDSMLAYLSPEKGKSSVPLEPEIQAKIDAIRESNNELLNKKQWLGEAEKIAFQHLKGCAPFVSPFSINNPGGWRYWLMHFANAPRARQVYNDILHQGGQAQAHFGRSGLNMLSYDPQYEGNLYLFDEDSRSIAKKELFDDIPKLIAEYGDTLSVEEFHKAVYSETPAHSDDINEMIFLNPDIEVITEAGGTRRNAIKPGDTLKLKNQKSIIFMFSD